MAPCPTTNTGPSSPPPVRPPAPLQDFCFQLSAFSFAMLRRDPGPTFSDLWYRVAPERPRLSPHAQLVRQQYGPAISYIVSDPATNRFYRLSESAWFFIGMLDGRCTVQEAWDACCAQLGDSAPTQRECIDALAKLQMFGLLIGAPGQTAPLAADMVLQRTDQAREQKIQKRTGRWMFFSIPLWNPEPLLERHKNLCRLVFGPVGAVVWIALVAIALWLVVANAGRLGSELNQILHVTPRGLLVLGLVFLALRAIHELGHAAACKAMGGRSTEIGLLLIAGVLPLPYCDASSAWMFPPVWKRVLVSAGGMLVEMAIAAVAAIVWALGEPGSPLASLAYNTMFVASLTTFLFNINPLLRYDGYYILSDIAGSPNLAQRSREMIKFLIHRYAFNVRSIPARPVRSRGELALLIVYGLLAVPYRVFIGVVILLVIWQHPTLRTLAPLLALIFAFAWLVWPLLKGAGHLLSAPELVGRRARAITIALLFLGALGVGIGLIPAPAAARATGVVDSRHRATARATEPGFVAEVHVGPGELVQAGQVLFTLENSELETEARTLRARLDHALARRDALAREPGARVEIAEIEIQRLTAQLDRIGGRLDSLIVRALVDGRVIPPPDFTGPLTNLIGKFVDRGTLLATVATTDDLVVRAALPETQRIGALATGADRASFRIEGDAGRLVPVSRIVVNPAASRDVIDPALTAAAGGQMLLDPADPERPRALTPHFMLVLEPAPGADLGGAKPGLRARIRIPAPAEPLGAQWLRSARQFFEGQRRS